MAACTMTNKVFLDTSFAIALSSPNDISHAAARQLAGEIKAHAIRLVTTRAVLLEIGNSLSKQRFRHAAVTLLQALEDDPNIEIIALTEELYHTAFQLFRERPDKEWGLVDCISFITMQEHGIAEVLTTDDHFRQMGFRILLN
jgi:predicted nucleic acid-binding protein